MDGRSVRVVSNREQCLPSVWFCRGRRGGRADAVCLHSAITSLPTDLLQDGPGCIYFDLSGSETSTPHPERMSVRRRWFFTASQRYFAVLARGARAPPVGSSAVIEPGLAGGMTRAWVVMERSASAFTIALAAGWPLAATTAG